MIIKTKLTIFKIKNFYRIFKSKKLKKKIKKKFENCKKNFEEIIKKKNFSSYWFLNNYNIFHYFLPQDYNEKFCYLEIGSYEGLSAFNVLYYYKNSKVTAIDLWDKCNSNSKSLNVNFSEVEKNFEENLNGYNYNKIKNDSVTALRKLLRQKNYFDVIYIDGSHNGEDILSDAIESFKLLKNNGIMIFDDIVNVNRNINVQSFEGFENFYKLYKQKVKILYLVNIAVIKKIN